MKDISLVFYRLSHYEEAAGVIEEIIKLEDALAVRIGKIRLSLPLDMEQSLRPLIGQSVSILRTDIPDKPYIFIVIAVEPNHVEEISLEADSHEK